MNSYKKLVILTLLLLSIAFGLIYCGGGGGDTLSTVPSAPQNVTPIAADGQVTISWDVVSGATSYNIYWNTTGSVTTSDTQITNVTSPYIHTGLTNNTKYYYAVTALNVILPTKSGHV